MSIYNGIPVTFQSSEIAIAADTETCIMRLSFADQSAVRTYGILGWGFYPVFAPGQAAHVRGRLMTVGADGTSAGTPSSIDIAQFSNHDLQAVEDFSVNPTLLALQDYASTANYYEIRYPEGQQPVYLDNQNIGIVIRSPLAISVVVKLVVLQQGFAMRSAFNDDYLMAGAAPWVPLSITVRDNSVLQLVGMRFHVRGRTEPLRVQLVRSNDDGTAAGTGNDASVAHYLDSVPEAHDYGYTTVPTGFDDVYHEAIVYGDQNGYIYNFPESSRPLVASEGVNRKVCVRVDEAVAGALSTIRAGILYRY